MTSYKFHKAMVALALIVVGLVGFEVPADAALTQVLGCTSFEPDGGGDRADLRGIRFTLQDNFQAIEFVLNTFDPGVYVFTAELRRSSGFTGDPLRTIRTSVEISEYNEPTLIHLDFSEVQVSGSETFTLRFVDFYGPESGDLYFEVTGDPDLCPNVEETEGNTGATPQVRFNEPWLRVLVQGQPSELSLTSQYVTTPPDIDGVIGFGEWPLSNKIEFESGFLTVVNDYHRLYVLVDILVDTNEEESDYFWLTFDVNRDGEITPHTDLQYGMNPYTGEMRYQYYLGPASWTGIQPETFSSMGKGFGCFFSDGTLLVFFNPFHLSCNTHRVWEFGIDLAEIGTMVGGTARIGLKVNSNAPAISEYIPSNYPNDFTNLIEVDLSSPNFFTLYPNPALSITLNQGSAVDPVEVSQAIQDRGNSLPLVEEKKTVARVYSQSNVNAQPGIISLYGSRNGVDLPGAPLALFHNSPTSIDREDIHDTANFLLPKSWTLGNVTFRAVARDLFSRAFKSGNIGLSFIPTETPTYWTLPLNTGTVSSPVLADDADMDDQEAFLKAIYPVPDVRFIRKSWAAVGTTSVGNAIDDLNYYYSVAVLAWILSGGSFDLPDQVYGFATSGGGISDPPWTGGMGRVARGSTFDVGIMAHEIIHNLGPGDCAVYPGTDLWGRHVSNLTSSMANGWCIPGDTVTYGCGATGADAGWQAWFDDAEIHEVGVDTSVTPFRLVPADKPEVMSYCEDTVLPTSWISDYRWERMFNFFQTSSEARMQAESGEALQERVQETIYIRGEVYPDELGGEGMLKPAMVQPGIPMTQEDVAPGIYAVELWLQEGEQPLDVITFTASFLGDIADAWDGKPRDRFPFNFRLSAFRNVAEIRLTKIVGQRKIILDTIVTDPFPPIVTVLSPTEGETWKGVGSVKWSASDKDSDSLSFSLLYSRDGGQTWMPMAPGIEGEIKGEGDFSFEVDTSTLPAGPSRVTPTSLFRVIATDGYNTSQDDSDLFFLIPNPPQVHIAAPEEGQVYPQGVLIIFQGSAEDEEDDVIYAEQMIWSYNGKPFGSGAETRAVLPYGTHDIRLTAVDSDDMEGSASVSITVAPVCEGDFEPDGDVDGADLAYFAEVGTDMAAFASDFGKTGCYMEPR